MSRNWKRIGKYGLAATGALAGGLAVFANMPPGVSYFFIKMRLTCGEVNTLQYSTHHGERGDNGLFITLVPKVSKFVGLTTLDEF